MHFLDPILAVAAILGTAMAFADFHNHNWRGTATGTACALLSIVALI